MPPRVSERGFQRRDNNHFHISMYNQAELTRIGSINFHSPFRSAAQQLIGATVIIGERTFQITETWGFQGEKRYSNLFGLPPGTVYANPNMGSHLPLVRVGDIGIEFGDCVLIRGMRLIAGDDVEIHGKGIKSREITDAPGSVAKVMGLTLNGQKMTLQIRDAQKRELALVPFVQETTPRRNGN